MTNQEKYNKYEKLARKSIIFKPFVFNRLYKYSSNLRKNSINKCIDTYTKSFNITKKERKFLRKDIAYCKAVYDILFKEYFFFNFKHKNSFERKSFVFNNKRQDYLYLLGEEEGQRDSADQTSKFKPCRLYLQIYRTISELGAFDCLFSK